MLLEWVQIVADSRCEENGLLRDVGNGRAKVINADRRDVNAIQQDSALDRVVEAEKGCERTRIESDAIPNE